MNKKDRKKLLEIINKIDHKYGLNIRYADEERNDTLASNFYAVADIYREINDELEQAFHDELKKEIYGLRK